MPQKLLALLSPAERRRAYLLLGMILVMAFLDVVGVASIMPFMAVLANPAVVETNRWLARAYQGLGFSDTDRFLFFLGVGVFVALVASIAFKALTTYALLRFTHMRAYSLSRRMVAGYLRQPYEWFLNRHSADLGKTVLSEVELVANGALLPMMQLIAQGVVVIALLILLILVDPLLALSVAAGVGGAYALIYLGLRRYLTRLGDERVSANRERFQTVQETFGGIKDVKVAGLEGILLRRFDEPARLYARVNAVSSIVGQMPRYALEAVAFGGVLLIVLYLMAGPGGLQQALPLLAVYAFAGYRLIPAVQQVYSHLTRLRFTGPALDRLHEDLMALAPDPGARLTVQRAAPMGLSHSLRLDEVTYRYPGAPRPVLNALTLEVPVHSTVGLVGATGSGKTTAVDVMLGLLRPESGQLCVDDTPITPDNARAWQRTVGYVPQQIYLADASVTANIAFGMPDDQIDHAAVARAARIANLHDFVIREMPAGYDTLVGERGVRLSGGQRQRIGIARALYHDPDVLILDEATSALDNLTEQAVMEAVHNLSHQKTIVLIAHRLSTVRDCDRIFMLEQGNLVGEGSYDELVERNVQFRRMVGGHG